MEAIDLKSAFYISPLFAIQLYPWQQYHQGNASKYHRSDGVCVAVAQSAPNCRMKISLVWGRRAVGPNAQCDMQLISQWAASLSFRLARSFAQPLGVSLVFLARSGGRGGVREVSFLARGKVSVANRRRACVAAALLRRISTRFSSPYLFIRRVTGTR